MTDKTLTNNDRQTSFRERKKAEGFSEVTMWVKNETLHKITSIAGSNDCTKGEVIDSLLTQSK
jgi:hypothetical protein